MGSEMCIRDSRGTASFKDIFCSFRFLQETPLVCFVFQVKLFSERVLNSLGEHRWTMMSRLLSLRAEGSESVVAKSSGRMEDAVGQCEDRKLNH